MGAPVGTGQTTGIPKFTSGMNPKDMIDLLMNYNLNLGNQLSTEFAGPRAGNQSLYDFNFGQLQDRTGQQNQFIKDQISNIQQAIAMGNDRNLPGLSDQAMSAMTMAGQDPSAMMKSSLLGSQASPWTGSTTSGVPMTMAQNDPAQTDSGRLLSGFGQLSPSMFTTLQNYLAGGGTCPA